ncbi:CHRD domain-containing protein [Mycetohabitans sp. B8]|uniref:CHRD domain-containing protein n=1 Tax=Mycetohabitans sp. B8 TaxID=2841845 RepID=UPI001F3D1DE1|nr:CHRD domain-containing protein [Mycetohabitans sp. B8]MCG1043397.1 CHRD domain-containing protein [Mycetohabitans sp. B8]
MTTTRLFAIVVTWLGVAGSSLAYADTVTFKADLQPSSEVPPKTSRGHGTLDATYDTSSRTLQWTAAYADLSAPVSAAHFHGPAPVGQNAGIQVPIDKNALASPIHGHATLNDDQAGELLAGKWYFNVHTAQNPGGEIRGQVLRTH